VKLKIKICGITKLNDALLCVEYGVDAIGFIFYKQSKRYITPQSAKKITEALPIFTHKIGVFVNEDYNEVNRIAKLVGLTAVQLHGNETPEYVSNITHPTIKAFGIDKDFDFSIINKFNNSTILLDVKDDEQHGGTGKSFDWEIIPKKIRERVIIAGGVSSNNLATIYKLINPYAVDLSSSVEISPGVKDYKKVIEILNIVNKLNTNDDGK